MATRKSEKPKEVPHYEEVINWAEFNRRKKIYDEYYAKCRETRAYSRFKEVLAAYRMGDMIRMKELIAEAKEAQLNQIQEIIPPPFKDPELEKINKHLGIGEVSPILREAYEVFGS